MGDAWQPIETAPKDGGIYVVNLIGDSEYEWTTANWAADTIRGEPITGWWEDGLWINPQPTHWFPLPTPPTPQKSPNLGAGSLGGER